LYGKGKLEVEGIAHSLGAWVIRPGLVFGSLPGGMFGRLVNIVKRFRFIPLPGAGKQRMYLVHEDDLADAVLRCVSRPNPPKNTPVTVANEHSWSFRCLLLEIAAALGKQVLLLPFPWQIMWGALLLAEQVNLPLGFSSDSLISLVQQNIQPVLNARELLQLECRPFSRSWLETNALCA